MIKSKSEEASPFVRNSPAAKVRDASDLFIKAIRARMRPYNLSLNQYRFLRELWEKEGVTQRTIAARMGVSESATVATVNRLVSRGLVRRVVDANDRRRSLIFLTVKGHALRDKVLSLNDDLNVLAAQGLKERDIDVLVKCLDQIIANLRQRKSAES